MQNTIKDRDNKAFGNQRSINPKKKNYKQSMLRVHRIVGQ